MLIRNYSHPLRAWWYYLVLRLFQFDRLQEEGPQRLFCKFYVNFSDKKDSNEKKIQFSKRLDVFIDIVSQYFGRCSFFSILKKDNYIFFWKKNIYNYYTLRIGEDRTCALSETSRTELLAIIYLSESLAEVRLNRTRLIPNPYYLLMQKFEKIFFLFFENQDFL